ncbi:hypothetical protein GALL_86900 [mine drainage metagenome]|uniref:DUF779 domain-containing protein n=1 Tax=mine drainage metagenome TaxID=410659 RepID=A0A1J5SMB0_9ZZZZ
MVERVVATAAAAALIGRLQDRFGPLVFHISGHCCGEGNTPICLRQSSYQVKRDDVLIGTLAGVPFYVTAAMAEYWAYSQLMVGAEPSDADSFSVETALDMRFTLDQRLFTDEEAAAL